jgi:cytoskeletal protein RodZ
MAADRPPGDVGGRLRAARERRGLSIRQVAASTKISAAALEGLEQNDASRLPGGIFSRAFVRSYAAEVGLDPDEAVQDFIVHFPHGAAGPASARAVQIEDNEALESDRRMAATVLWLIVVSLPVAGVVLYFSAAGRRSRASPPLAPSALAAPARTTAAAVVPSVDRLTITVSAARACWLTATVDGVKSFERRIEPGERQTFDVYRALVMTAGDASAIAMTLNGAAAKPLGKTGEVITARVDLTNFKEFLLPQ